MGGREVLVSSFVIVTVAPATRAPLVSVTVPESRPTMSCATPGKELVATNRPNSHTQKLARIPKTIAPLLCVLVESIAAPPRVKCNLIDTELRLRANSAPARQEEVAKQLING